MLKKIISYTTACLVYYLFPGFVHQIREDLRWALYRDAELEPWEKRNIEDTILRHLACMAADIIEILFLGRMTKKKFTSRVRVLDESNLRLALSRGKGAILLIAHFGNWEYIGYWLSRIAGVDIASFYLDQYSKTLDRFLNTGRVDRGIKLIHREDLKTAIRHLKSNGVLALISDQDGLSTGEYIYFFDRLVSAPRGAAKFATKFGCPVIPVFIFRNVGDFSHNIVFGSDLTVQKNGLIRNEIKKHYNFFESIIGDHPHEWLWPYKRWKRRRHVVREAYRRGLAYHKTASEEVR